MAEETPDDERSAGAVKITVGGEVMVLRYEDLIDDAVEVPLFCPVCGRTGGLTLSARGRTAELACPCGHTWSDPAVAACGVRQLLHLKAGRFPGTRVRTVMLPRIEEPQEPDRQPPEPPWQVLSWEDRVLRATGHPALTGCLDRAVGLTAWALPGDGLLYDRLYPPAGGNAVDAHMTVVLVALALYASAYDTDTVRPGEVRLTDMADGLSPRAAVRLRRLRPCGLPGGGRLRLTDVHRLDTALEPTWARWAENARRVVTLNASSDEGPAEYVTERGRWLPDVVEGAGWYQETPESPGFSKQENEIPHTERIFSGFRQTPGSKGKRNGRP